jgi:2-polyprenyl-3-methyl-5-hydroxy-6-metoxy-1,4-benzoquinol methylase
VNSSEIEVRGTWKRSYSRHELLTVNCPRCQSDDGRRVAREFGIVIARCDRCGLTYTQTPLTDSQGHYHTDREHILRKYGHIFNGAAPHPRDRNYDEHLGVLEAVTTGRDLLDIGSHAGFFLRRAVARGWNAIGIEPSPVTSALAREQFGLDVRTGTLAEVDLPSQSFDVVTLTDVLEHIGEPGPLLTEIRRLLRPQGVLFVKVPNVRYLHAKRRLLGWIPGVIDDCFDAREHLVHYSATTLRESLAAAGFVVEAIAVPRPIQSGGRPRRALRALGPALARQLPRGAELPLATDLTGIARR